MSEIDTRLPPVKQVMKRSARVFGGDARCEGEGKIFSALEPRTGIIRKGKAAKSQGFGKILTLQAAKNQIVTDCEVTIGDPTTQICSFPLSKPHA
jgi:hypothetical protein